MAYAANCPYAQDAALALIYAAKSLYEDFVLSSSWTEEITYSLVDAIVSNNTSPDERNGLSQEITILEFLHGELRRQERDVSELELLQPSINVVNKFRQRSVQESDDIRRSMAMMGWN